MKDWKQLGLLLFCCVGGDTLSIVIGRRIPGNVLGMVLLLVLLLCGHIREAQVADTSDFLLQNMTLFFLPASLGLLDIVSDIRQEILAIAAVCVLTTLCTALATAGAVHLVYRLQKTGRVQGTERSHKTEHNQQTKRIQQKGRNYK